MLPTTEDVHISNCTFADSIFACIGIGSETSGGIRDVWIKDCKFTGAKTQAIYIKSRPGRGAFIENIYADGLEVSNCTGGFLRLKHSQQRPAGSEPGAGPRRYSDGAELALLERRGARCAKARAGDGARPAQAARRTVADEHYRHLQGGDLPGACAPRG